MPKSAQHVCPYPGCTALVEHGYCSKHDAAQVIRDPNRRRLYDREWRKVRALQLSREPWCAQCLKDGQYVEATDVHHIERHEGDVVKFKTGRLQSLCHRHHSAETAKEVGLGAPR
jgi:5-methylcytosine-specific restriction protein A